MADPQYIAEKVRKLKAEGWTQRAIGMATGLNFQMVSRILRGKAKIAEEQDIHKVVKVYRCKDCGNLVWLRPCAICENEQ